MSSREINCSGKGSVVSFCTRKKKKKSVPYNLWMSKGFLSVLETKRAQSGELGQLWNMCLRAPKRPPTNPPIHHLPIFALYRHTTPPTDLNPCPLLHFTAAHIKNRSHLLLFGWGGFGSYQRPNLPSLKLIRPI